ncbi:MAG: hypothetical protein EZS28_023754, partial [Streblomastix strix]
AQIIEKPSINNILKQRYRAGLEIYRSQVFLNLCKSVLSYMRVMS